MLTPHAILIILSILILGLVVYIIFHPCRNSLGNYQNVRAPLRMNQRTDKEGYVEPFCPMCV